ncbi:hypothetical protein GA0115240_15683 [Streptomyces sp. DvalAA-14]|uniref:hypothetical protein n=1 Tax=unclassified Streptomyces TaxID=2593676 RepID=UPI00081AF7A6|nr:MULTISPECIES: hypothetical protein [unclassified Streptomyces]SCE39490.1 hypothetical protein GA0115240_15683 [Streptomyces sp. DvalAA-14]
MQGWMWWVIGLFAVGGFTTIADSARSAMRTRHERTMEKLAVKQRDRLALEAAGRPPEPVCGCTHHLAKHDKQGKCHEVVEVPTAWDADRKPVSFEPGTCNCQQYVGPQPLARVYAEEISDF